MSHCGHTGCGASCIVQIGSCPPLYQGGAGGQSTGQSNHEYKIELQLDRIENMLIRLIGTLSQTNNKERK